MTKKKEEEEETKKTMKKTMAVRCPLIPTPTLTWHCNAKGVPPFLVPVIATIVLTIAKLNKNHGNNN